LEKKKNGQGDRVVGLCLDVTVTATSKNTTKSASATGTAGMTLQNGVEMLNLVTLTTSTVLTALVTDLSGDVLWAYDPGTSVPAGSLVEPIKLLPNGHFLITFTVSTAGLALSSVLRAVDLAGTVIWQMTSTDLDSNFDQLASSRRGGA
jgi:hypothetical protein